MLDSNTHSLPLLDRVRWYTGDMRKLDLVGQKFSRLTVLSEVGKNRFGQILWSCLCECGEKSVVTTNKLRMGDTSSCGCLRIEKIQMVGFLNKTHGEATKKTLTYTSWSAMKNRCYNKNYNRYKDWGGRGIKICKRWMKFENFLEDMGQRKKGTTLDRINNNGNYTPNNCRWATAVQQIANRRPLTV